jgi:hypothetical protein
LSCLIEEIFTETNQDDVENSDDEEYDQFNDEESNEGEYRHIDIDTGSEESDSEEDLSSNFHNKVTMSSKPKSADTPSKSTSGSTVVPKAKKAKQKMSIELPTILYEYVDSDGQQYVSVDVLLLSGMDSTGVVPKIRPCGTILDFLINIPVAFFRADRLELHKDDVKQASLVKHAHKLLKIHGQSEDSYRVRLVHSVTLPFQVRPYFSNKYTNDGYETIRMEAGNLTHASVCSVDMIAAVMKLEAAFSPPVRDFRPKKDTPNHPTPDASMS